MAVQGGNVAGPAAIETIPLSAGGVQRPSGALAYRDPTSNDDPLADLVAALGSPLQAGGTVTATWGSALPVSVASLPLPTGAALESGGNLAAVLAKLNGSVAVTGTFWQATQPVSLPGPSYAAAAALTCVTTSLASDANLLAGRASAAIDNTSNKYKDALLSGTIATTGSPTADTQINVYVYGGWNNGSGAVYANGVTGSDANFTCPGDASGNLLNQFALATVIAQYDATARTYTIGPFSVAALFGGVMPACWGVFVVHNTGTTLGATALSYQGVS